MNNLGVVEADFHTEVRTSLEKMTDIILMELAGGAPSEQETTFRQRFRTSIANVRIRSPTQVLKPLTSTDGFGDGQELDIPSAGIPAPDPPSETSKRGHRYRVQSCTEASLTVHILPISVVPKALLPRNIFRNSTRTVQPNCTKSALTFSTQTKSN